MSVPCLFLPRLAKISFLSSRPDEESHKIALFANPAFAHIAFQVSSLSELRAKYERVLEKDISIRFTAGHGCSLLYLFDAVADFRNLGSITTYS